MNAPDPFPIRLTASALALRLLVQQLDEAQRLERGLWSTKVDSGTDELATATHADVAWMHVSRMAEGLVATPNVEWQGRERRLAAALLLAIVESPEPKQARRLQAMAQALSDEHRGGRRSGVDRLLHLIGRGPFVTNSDDTLPPDVSSDGEENENPVLI